MEPDSTGDSVGHLLTAIRLADTAFPSGGFAFSSGLEGAYRDGHVRNEDDVHAFVAEQVTLRWHTGDRVLLRMAWSARNPVHVDRLADATSPMSVLRAASTRAGTALLGTFAALGHEAAADYRSAVRSNAAVGHLPIAQAVCYRCAGLDCRTAESIAGWQMIAGIAGAATRLGIVGHIGAQRVVGHASTVLAEALALQPPARPAAFSWFADIAAQRSTDGVRLFAS
ncbi:urease accessory protein UreF [Gordonia rubripertincta]|uniref:Urease accessory protein UreF n=1 Tax=Gordonia rubripertincta TaxID=36822 RepID=A0AAW4G827_GORRU|nr:urease accessory UreF family protein [Gordonia rubripertincta]MBM7279283.1 urease accessory protein UreF [Gordonia rubripertincta]